MAAPTTYRVSATVSGTGGSVKCSPGSVASGGSAACQAYPDPGYELAYWEDDCSGADCNPVCTLTNINSSKDALASFWLQEFQVTASVVGGHGSLQCDSPVCFGEDSSCVATPNPGYQVSGWTGACALTGPNVQCDLPGVSSDLDSTVSFSLIPPSTYTVTAKVSGSGGTTSCSPTSVTANGSSTCTAKPKPGYQVITWTGACASAGTSAICSLGNNQSNLSSQVTFSLIPTFAVSACVVGGNGNVSCSPSTVNVGGRSVCTAVPIRASRSRVGPAPVLHPARTPSAP